MSDTPRTDAQIIQFGDGPAKYVYASFADELERENAKLRKDSERLESELAELKSLHQESYINTRQYTPECWKRICDIQEPIAVWLNGKQVTALMKDSERLDWLLSVQTIWESRDEIDEDMANNPTMGELAELRDWMLREYNIYRFGYQRLTRNDIDDEMKGESI